MTVWSLTPFFNELDLLEIRLAELDPVVDVHVIAESPATQSGLPKPFHYRDNMEQFARWHHKIRYVMLCDPPSGNRLADPPMMLAPSDSSGWEREAWQRDGLLRGCDGLADDDVVLLSDLDEIPRADVLERMVEAVAEDPRVVRRPALGLHMYWLNWRWFAPHRTPICGTTSGRLLIELGPQGVRRQRGIPFGLVEPGPGSGWHFSYQSGVQAVQEKLAAAAHHEVNRAPFNQREWIDGCLTTGRDLFGRNRPMVSIPRWELPGYVLDNLPRFTHLIGPELAPPASETVQEYLREWAA